MKLWRLYGRPTEAFAYARGHSAWSAPGKRGIRRRVPPLTIEWLPDSDVIADFTWLEGCFDIALVTEQVGSELARRFRGFKLAPVQMVQDPKVKRPQRVTRRTKPRIWLPYEGPPLRALWITAEVPADEKRSTMRLSKDEPVWYGADGVEYIDIQWDQKTRTGSYVRVPREPGKGFYVPEDALRGIDVFFVEQVPFFMFCTDRVRDFILGQQYTNIDFLEIGETF